MLKINHRAKENKRIKRVPFSELIVKSFVYGYIHTELLFFLYTGNLRKTVVPVFSNP